MTDLITPTVGMGAYVDIGSDTYAYTITEVHQTKDGFDIKVQADMSTPGPGHNYYKGQVWLHMPNRHGACMMFRWQFHKAVLGWREITRGKYNDRRVFVQGSCYRLTVGKRHKYVCPEF